MKLTPSKLIWLSDLADGQWHDARSLALGRNITPRGAGAVSKLFGEIARLGFAEWKVINDKSCYRITDAGRLALNHTDGDA